MTDPVPTIPEAEARGPVAALYADIRATLGVPVVNLIWRHLAALPGGLEWTWRAARPLYASGAAEAGAARIRAALVLPDLPPWPAELLRAADLDRGAVRAVSAVLASYDRGNSLNFAALGALRLASLGERGGGPPPVREAEPLEVRPPLLPDMEALDPSTRGLVLALDALGKRDGDRIAASLYRHLAHWPALLALAWAVLAPLERDGRLADIIAAGAESARGICRGLLGGLDLPAGNTPEGVAEAIGQFVDHPIARMVPVSSLLLRLWPDDA